MSDAIMALLELINSLILGVGRDGGALTAQLGDFLDGVYRYSLVIMESVAMPVAYTVLALFFVMELYKTSVKVEGAGGGGQFGAEMVFRVMIKMVICKTILDETPNILTAIFNLATGLTISIRNIVGGETPTGGLDIAAIEPMVSDLGFWGGIPVIIIVCIILLVTLVAVGLANVIIVARFVELFVYICISPIPLATLPNEEMSQIGKNFLKSFAAVCVQGTLIFIVLSFFPILFNDGFLNSRGSGDIYIALLGIFGYSIVLILAIFSTGKWAKSICNAM